MLLDPHSPAFNTVIFYILLLLVLLLYKPSFVWDDEKKQFKKFELPLVSMTGCILLYIIFSSISMIGKKFTKQTN